MSELKSINPYNQKLLEEFQELSDEAIDEKLNKSKKVFHSYRKSSFSERSKSMFKVASILRQESRSLATTITLEMGKPLKESVGRS